MKQFNNPCHSQQSTTEVIFSAAASESTVLATLYCVHNHHCNPQFHLYGYHQILLLSSQESDQTRHLLAE